jgi:hypothetical protein
MTLRQRSLSMRARPEGSNAHSFKGHNRHTGRIDTNVIHFAVSSLTA